MNIGDLVTDDWGELAIVLSQVGAIHRWRIRYISNGQITATWEDNLYPLGSTEIQKKLHKNT